MSKQRLLLSSNDAVTYVIAMLGEGGIRSATGKSLSMAYAWVNPDDEREISFIDAAKLDGSKNLVKSQLFRSNLCDDGRSEQMSGQAGFF